MKLTYFLYRGYSHTGKKRRIVVPFMTKEFPNPLRQKDGFRNPIFLNSNFFDHKILTRATQVP